MKAYIKLFLTAIIIALACGNTLACEAEGDDVNSAHFGFIDGHADTITAAMESGQGLFANDLHLDIERLRAFGTPVQVFAIWLDDKYVADAFAYTNTVIDFFESELAEHDEYIRLALSLEDMERNARDGVISAVLAIEGGEPLEGKIENLDHFYERGVRMLTLTWNRENALGYGAATGSTKGLKPFGAEVVQRCDELGIIIDVSHLNESGFKDVCELGTRPFVASHSNARAVTSNRRNLTDAQIQAVADKGGLIGMNFYPGFLVTSGTASYGDIHKHIKHMIEIGVGDHIGLGCDFDGVETLPKGIDGVQSLNEFNDKLIDDFGAETAEAIMYNNYRAFFGRFFGEPCAP